MPSYTDTFTDTDGTALTAHTSDGGQSWTKHPWYAGLAAIASNRLRADSNNVIGVYVWSQTPASADYRVTGDLVRLTGGGGSNGLQGRVDSAQDTMYRFNHSGGSNWVLEKRVNGVATTLISGSSYSPAVGETVQLELALSGTTVEILRNGVSLGAVTDSAIGGAGQPGVMVFFFGTPANAAYAIDTFGLVEGGGGGPPPASPPSRLLLGVGV